jgi:hypothetical protein
MVAWGFFFSLSCVCVRAQRGEKGAERELRRRVRQAEAKAVELGERLAKLSAEAKGAAHYHRSTLQQQEEEVERAAADSLSCASLENE